MKTETLKIERGIPIPPPKAKLGATSVLRDMKVGDSVLVPRHHGPSWHATANAIGMEVAVRAVSETESRVWRIK